MRHTKIYRILTQVSLAISLLFTIGLNSVSAQESVNSLDYAPGLFYQYYEHDGRGNEFAPFTMTLDYAPDENGIYQVSRATGGTTISYIFQISADGIYELAYFPESYDQADWRYHDDVYDELKSLFFPATLTVGDTFSRGYRANQEFTVTDYRQQFVIEDITYYNVLVIESVLDEGEVQRYYYAPEVGEIFSEYIIDDENSVVTSLNFLRGPTYINPMQ